MAEGSSFSLGEWFQTAVWDVQAFFGDKDARSHAEALREVNSQRTEEDRMIYTTIESQDIHFTGVLGALDVAGNAIRGGAGELWSATGGFWQNLKKALKALPWIVIAVGIGIGLYYIWPKLFKK